MSDKPLKICLASSELAPLAKTGGLADVAAALGAYLHRAGHDVRILVPSYARIRQSGIRIEPVPALSDLSIRVGSRKIHYAIDRTELPGSKLPVYLLRCPAFYDRDGIYTQDADEHLRFVMLSRAALEMCQRLGFAPDIVHCNDWHTALIPLYLRSIYAWDKLFARTRTVLTIHNIGYQGMFPTAVLGDLDFHGAEHHLHQDDLNRGVINFLKTGILYADVVTAVSPTYAREIQTEEFGMGLDGLLRERADTVIGILNGVDYDEWNPATDEMIPAAYDVDDIAGKANCKQQLQQAMRLEVSDDTPLVGIVTRLVGQKGIELMEAVLPGLMRRRRLSLAVLGSGEPRFEHFFQWLQREFPGRACFYRGYNNKLAHWIEAGSDMFLMPSLYEPCGLNQMYSLRYGTIPIVRRTGGLADSVRQVDIEAGSGDGIVFEHYTADGLRWALNTALDLYHDQALWQRFMRNGMRRDFSWDRQGRKYVDLYRQLSATP